MELEQLASGFSSTDLVGMFAAFYVSERYTIGGQQFTPWQSYDSFYGEFDDADGTHRVLHRSILVGMRLYHQTVRVPLGAVEPERPYYEKFFNSFALTGGG